MSDDTGDSPPRWNGIERRQDKELEELRDGLSDMREEITINRNANELQHLDIATSAEDNHHRVTAKIDAVKDVTNHNAIELSKVAGTLKGSSKAHKRATTIALALFLAMLPALGWFLGRSETRLDILETDVKVNTETHKAFRRDIDKNEADIESVRQIQRIPHRGPSVWPAEEE